MRSFALIDCIVATVLLGSSLAVIIGLCGRALTSQSIGEHLSTAAMLADEQLQLVLARGADDYARQFPTQGQCDEPFKNYSFKLAFAGGQSVGDPHQVACTISWTVGGIAGREDYITVDTLIAPRTGAPDSQPNPVRTPRQTIDRLAE